MNDQASQLRDKLKFQNVNRRKAKTLAVISGKGGVGKSNTALNFAISLQTKGKEVLLFDLDIGMGNIDILLGNTAKYTIMHFFNQSLPIHDIIELGPKGLSYIAGGTSLSEIVHLDNQKLQYFYEQYTLLTASYDYIIFDLGAGMTKSSLSFILSADECIVVTTPEPTAMTDAYSMMKHIVVNEASMPFLLILNRVPSIKAGKRYVDNFKEVVWRFLHKDIQKVGILPDDQVVTKAVMHQTPYMLFDKNAQISKAMDKLVVNYLITKTTQDDNQPSFIEKLKGFLARK